MNTKPFRLLARRGLDGLGRDAALEVVRGWMGRTRQSLPLPVTKSRKL